MRMMVSGRYVGDLIDGTLVKRGKQVQKMYSMDGFGVAKQLLNRREIENIELHYDDYVYTAPVETFQRFGIPYHHPPFEPQLILPVNHFQMRSQRQVEMF